MNSFKSIIITILGLLLSSNALSQSSLDIGSGVPLIEEKEFDQTVKLGLCIVLFVNPDLHENDDKNLKSMYGLTPVQFADQLVRSVKAFKERIASTVKVLKVNWKDWPADPGSLIRFTAGPFPFDPQNPVFVTYDVNGAVAERINGPLRPDALTWLVHEIVDYYIHSIKTYKGEYLRVGWLITDTNLPFIYLVDERKGEHTVNGKTEEVQIITHMSAPYDGASYQFQRIYTKDGRLLGSIECYGSYGTFGYFDYDGTGKFQYRVWYPSCAGE